MKVLLLALSFMMIFEGLMPMVAPGLWQKALKKIANESEDQVRKMGMLVVVGGLLCAWIVMEYVS